MFGNSDSYPVAFAFKVEFLLIGQVNADVAFQDVSGLSVKMDSDTWNEGGENRFAHTLPNRPKYNPLVLKRALVNQSPLVEWIRKAIEEFEFYPIDLIVKLLDEKQKPLVSWSFINAWPIGWEVSNFNAEEAKLAIESLTIQYDYFRRVN